jgi:tetratricopeptide (TPR) repeat protein
MSGGPVFNDKGELIGVHGKGDQAKADIETSNINADVSYIKSGFNLGIPINTFLRLSAKSGIDFGVSPPPQRVSTAPKADDFLIQALDKYQKGDYQGAIVAYNEAVRLNPKLQAAIVDHYQQSELNRKSTEPYNKQGLIRLQTGDIQGAFADFNQALKINPDDAIAYIGRGTARYELGNKKAAIADFNQAIKINPNNEKAYSLAYASRGIARYELGEKQAAIEDFKQAFKINPNLDPKLQAKIAQYYQQPLQNLNPTKTYTGDGFSHLELEDHQEALAAFNQALQVNPNDALAYIGRGTARYKLGDTLEDDKSSSASNASFAVW